jgi:predicted methyltransferase
MKGGYENEMMNAFYDVLKPNGVLGIVEHRANDNTDIDVMKQSGYVTESYVIELAKKAGFILEARSEINANPKDTKYHPNGVWTLPPTLKVGESDPAVYLAIGESDRMTLKFRKPAL